MAHYGLDEDELETIVLALQEYLAKQARNGLEYNRAYSVLSTMNRYWQQARGK